jgi:hypothetical protein
MQLCCAFGFVMLLSTTAQAAEHDWPAPLAKDVPERVSLSVTNRAGLVTAPFFTTAFPQVSGFGMVLQGDIAVRLSSRDWLRARLPVSFVRLDFPAGAQVAETALGNLELALEHEIKLRPATRLQFLGGWLAPTAEQGARIALLNNRALALGSALNGGKDAPLFTPGVSGLRLGASVEHFQRSLELRASFDVPVLVRVADARLPAETQTHLIGILPALDLRAAYWLTSWFGASFGGALITEPFRVQEPTRERDRNRRLQAVVEPALHFGLGRHVLLGLDGSIPVGGNLGGKAWSIGLSGRLAL